MGVGGGLAANAGVWASDVLWFNYLFYLWLDFNQASRRTNKAKTIDRSVI